MNHPKIVVKSSASVDGRVTTGLGVSPSLQPYEYADRLKPLSTHVLPTELPTH